ncbi:MAG: aminoglycoside phosphotransferase family protein [Chloroflexota bacterium]
MADYSSQTLTQLVCAHLDVDTTSLRFERIRTGKHNSSYWVDTNLGRFVLRLAPPDDLGYLFYERLMMRQEPALHTLIRENTSLPVADIVGYDFSRSTVDCDYVLMTTLRGRPLSEATLTPQALARTLSQVGEHLRVLHTLTSEKIGSSSQYGYLGAHQPMDPQSTWVDAFQIMWHKLLDDVEACGSYTTKDADLMRSLFDQHLTHFERPVTPSLLHMDIWMQNILVDSRGTVTGLVDFDRALWGDVEIEFAVLDYCGISEAAFWEGYGQPRDVSPSAKIRQLFYLLYEVQKYMPIEIWRRNNPTKAAHYKARSLKLTSALLPQ